jgi:tight adherence protein B
MSLLAAGVLLSWPETASRIRLRALCPGAAAAGTASRANRWRVAGLGASAAVAVRPGAAGVVAVVLLGAGVAGVGGLVAGVLAAATIGGRVAARRRARGRARELAALLDAVAVMAAELRAGAHPSLAAKAAGTGTARVHRLLRSAAAAARLGAQVPALLRRHAVDEPAIAAELSRLAGAWTLADRHGIALAELMDAVRTDLDARVRHAGQVEAQLAGPRATAAVLAGLPVIAILLGEGIGAHPWRVLAGTPVGQVLLVVGVGLSCVGTLWSDWVMRRGTAA